MMQEEIVQYFPMCYTFYEWSIKFSAQLIERWMTLIRYGNTFRRKNTIKSIRNYPREKANWSRNWCQMSISLFCIQKKSLWKSTYEILFPEGDQYQLHQLTAQFGGSEFFNDILGQLRGTEGTKKLNCPF